MFHFNFTQFLQIWFPFAVLRQVIRHAFREQDVPCVAAIHHALGNVDPSASNVCPLVHISSSADWPAVNTHAQLKMRIALQLSANLNRAFYWRSRTGKENQRHSIAGGQRS